MRLYLCKGERVRELDKEVLADLIARYGLVHFTSLGTLLYLRSRAKGKPYAEDNKRIHALRIQLSKDWD